MKKTLSFKFLCLLISGLMVLCLLAACAGNEDNNETTGGKSDNTDSADSNNVNDEGYLLDDVPTDILDYNSRTIKILYWSDVEHEEFQSAGLNGDLVNDAIHQRNLNVEDRLGIKLEFIPCLGDSGNLKAWVSHVETNITAGTNEFDLMAGYSLSVAATANAGYCYNLLDSECEYLNFDMPWWPDRLITEATINDKLYFCSGDMSVNALYMMYVCFVNTDIVSDMELENVFDLVDNNLWTYEKFIEMCSNVYIDTDGNGSKSVGDRYGYMTSGIHCEPWFYGSGALIVDKDANGNLRPSPSFSGERVIKTLELLNGLLYNTNDGLYTTNIHNTYMEFSQGSLLFTIDRARISFTRFTSESLHFSIVPFPKFDSNQEKFVTLMGNPFTLYAITSNAKEENLPMLSAILEVYASESYRVLTPEVYETTLKIKYVQEENSARMYDIIRENLTFDLGRIFSNVLIGQGTFRGAVEGNSANSWKSLTRGQSSALEKKLEALQSVFEN